ncbi:hypothetical protein Swit_5330 (plasmid) [Rhizorhabdus wittichii RW1]|uniref:Uncharacterized protein n=1 Tax=Rhizorhabdus wittichii (strain DSM 6014 / CCUG 31198 / JCM 15750 / NBRC 105917 / EY 4224 / RW1) TaxID=392499 RepID=A0A9J9HGL7_RHIWR|nr:hypothetical protein Swit_5330 [Rhizorhabdus wittichii RW1]
MAFSYTLFLVLLLIFPGLCFWAGWRFGERTDFLSPSPDVPNSTLTLFIVVIGTLLGHLLGTTAYTLQSLWCRTGLCLSISFDPNIYRALVKGVEGAGTAPDAAFEIWLFSMLMVGIGTGSLAYWLSRQKWVTDRLDPVAFGWLAPAVQAVKRGDSFVVAYVLTGTSHEGSSIAYEGTVQQLALDGDQSIKLIVLNDVDRFLVKITDNGLQRLESEATPIVQLQIAGDEIVNVALEIVRAPEQDVAAVEEAGEEAHDPAPSRNPERTPR